MEGNIRAEERKQFFRYFKVWIIFSSLIVALWIFHAVYNALSGGAKVRNNPDAPTQRVYDYADVLTDEQERKLTQAIAEYEERGKCDIILVLISEEMGRSDATWERNMMNYADDFYDEGAFGYDKPHGDGVLILDNWYEDSNGSQQGTWISTSGKMEDIIGPSEENDILDAMYAYISNDPVKGYEAAIRKTALWGSGEAAKAGEGQISWLAVVVVPIIVAVIFALTNINQKAAKDTTTASTYVAGGKPQIRRRQDDFLRKTVTSVRIQTESRSGSSGGSHRGGGSAGHHVSSGGHSHGGGGRRR